jgi:penicillin-binding protein 1C
MYDRKGELLGARVAKDEQWRFPPGEEVNGKFAAAIVEYEDRRFYRHIGVDPLAAGRALVQNIRAKRIVSGASTITMQTIRIMRKNRNRSILEKILEGIRAIRLEAGYSKQEILGLYAANAPFGGNVVGLEAASWRWFGHAPKTLSWGEAAALAVLPNSPSLIRPGRNEALLRLKRDALLRRLHEKAYLEDETLTLAMAEPLPGEPKPLPMLAPHLMARILAAGNAENRVETTLDGAIQGRVSEVLNRWAGTFSGKGIMNAACLILDTPTGEVRAYIGNVRHQGTNTGEYVDIIMSPRSSGSILKPFLFAAMLDSGELLPHELVSDIPTHIAGWRPENYTRGYTGVIPAAEALARSLNIPAVQELRSFGVNRFAAFLGTLGVTTLFRPPEQYGLPLILGGAEVSLWEMAGIYAALARTALYSDEGTSLFFPPVFRVFSPSPMQQAPRTAKRGTLSPGAAWLTLNALAQGSRPAEEAAWRQFAGSHNIAWKTGTSFGARDAWAIGVTSRWTVAVWAGNASGEGRAELAGSTTAAPVLFELFSFLESAPWFEKPRAELDTIEVCAFSGFPPGPNCSVLKPEEIPRGAPGHRPCPFCRVLTLNEDGTLQVSQNSSGGLRTVRRNWFVLPPAEEWYYKRWNLDYKPPPPESAAAQPPLALFNPEEGALLYLPIELDGRPGKAVFTAAHRDMDGILYWHLDDVYLGATTNFHEMELRPLPGPHILTVLDSGGNMIQRRFTIVASVE